MIPKILHTGFFGDWPWNAMNLRCHASWDKILPGWARMDWNPGTFPKELFKVPWMLEATGALRRRERLGGANLNFGAYMCCWLLHKYGGISVNNDLELVKAPDLTPDCFLGWQNEDTVNWAICGNVPGHWYWKAMMDHIVRIPWNSNPLDFGPALLTKVLQEHGLRVDGKEQVIEGVHVFPRETFYPWTPLDRPTRAMVTPRTVGLHWWEGSWYVGKRSHEDHFDFVD